MEKNYIVDVQLVFMTHKKLSNFYKLKNDDSTINILNKKLIKFIKLKKYQNIWNESYIASDPFLNDVDDIFANDLVLNYQKGVM